LTLQKKLYNKKKGGAMKNFLLIIFFPFILFGATGFLINGDSVVNLRIGSKLQFEGYLEGGDSIVNWVTYVDLDNNGIIEPGDPVMRYAYGIDGRWNDIDETKNGYISGNTETGTITGNFIYVAEDAGGSDQCVVHVQPSNSSYSVSGQITPDSAGFPVMAVPASMEGVVTGVITDENGNYSINIPDSLSGQYFRLFVMVIDELFPDYVGAVSTDSVFLSGHESLDVSLPKTDSTVLNIYLVDEDGVPYTNTVSIQAMGRYTDATGQHAGAKFGFVKDGFTSMLLHSSPNGENGNTWDLQVAEDGNMADPYSMFPNDTSLQFDFPPDTITDTITVFSCDAAIAGSVFVDGIPADSIELWAESDYTGEAPEAGTYSNGYYKIRVSSYADSYTVGLKQFDWSLYGGDKNVAPGSEGVNFYVITSGIEEKQPSRLQNTQYLITGPKILEISGVSNTKAELRIYDVTGKLIKSLSPEKNTETTARYKLNGKILSTGIYFGKVKGKKGTIKLTVIKK
jgi:hypothetical protein